MSARTRVVLVALAAVAVTVFVATVPTFRHFFDLGVYRGAVRDWLIDGGDLYSFTYRDTDYGFTYPPFAALVMSPLSVTSWPVAIAAGLLVNAACVTVLLRWYLLPIADRRGWPRWTAVALAFLAFGLFEPARDTFSFGQINLVLLVLVFSDLRNHRWRGVGAGLAAAIKLTPAVFILYLLVARRYKAAATAGATAAGATVLAFLIAPGPSKTFWTAAVWDTARIGKLDYVSNQSLRGVVARLDLPATYWLVAVLAVLAYWFWWITTQRPALPLGYAATGLVACLISPVTWVHHLVWTVPALFLLLDRALAPAAGRRRLIAVGVVYALMCSSVVWLWWNHAHGILAMPGADAYVWLTLAMLIALTADRKPALLALSPV